MSAVMSQMQKRQEKVQADEKMGIYTFAILLLFKFKVELRIELALGEFSRVAYTAFFILLLMHGVWLDNAI